MATTQNKHKRSSQMLSRPQSKRRPTSKRKRMSQHKTMQESVNNLEIGVGSGEIK
jgi:hypothetical protein